MDGGEGKVEVCVRAVHAIPQEVKCVIYVGEMTMTELRETYTTVHSSMCSTQSLRSSTPSHSGIVHCLHQNRSLSPRRHKSSTKDESSSYPAHYTD